MRKAGGEFIGVSLSHDEQTSMQGRVVKASQTAFGPEWKGLGGLSFPRGMYNRKGILADIGKLLTEGMTNREISRDLGVRTRTVSKLRKVLELTTGIVFKCPCGKPATHQGWCKVRFQRSEKRKLTLAKLHKKQKGLVNASKD